jgi:hypothetical protein
MCDNVNGQETSPFLPTKLGRVLFEKRAYVTRNDYKNIDGPNVSHDPPTEDRQSPKWALGVPSASPNALADCHNRIL